MSRNALRRAIAPAALAAAIVLLSAWPSEAAELPRESCVLCHLQLEGIKSQPVRSWSKSIHARANIGCADCHGGDTSAPNMAKAHGKGFKGVPSPKDVPLFCGGCHSDASAMRQYSQRTDQLQLYRISEHGQKLKKGDTKVATCISCHGSHEVYEVYDPVSSVYKPNVPATCAKCHSDKEYMKGYGIATDQFEEYRAGYHGALLLDKNNFKVPTCADCHGVHGASPPTVEEVVSVCGKCHVVTAKYFQQSPHWRAVKEGGLPNCATCHGHHRINFPGEGLFSGSESDRCGSCHREDSTAYAVGQTFSRRIENIRSTVAQVDASLLELKQLGGFEISSWREELREASAKLTEAIPVTHSLSVHLMERRAVEADDKLNELKRLVAKRRERIEFRQTGLVVTLSLIGIMVGLLVLKKRSL